jgi:hypothetical protein
LGSKALRARKIDRPSDLTLDLAAVWRKLLSDCMREPNMRILGRQILWRGNSKQRLMGTHGYDCELAAARFALRRARVEFELEERLEQDIPVRTAELVRMIPKLSGCSHVRTDRVLKRVAVDQFIPR